MELKDLSQEQVIEIAKLLYGFPEYIKSDFDCCYYPYERASGNNNEDQFEHYLIRFSAIVFGDTITNIRVWIYSNLDCEIDYYNNDDNGKMIVSSMDRLPCRNQRLIQKKFTEFGF